MSKKVDSEIIEVVFLKEKPPLGSSQFIQQNLPLVVRVQKFFI